MMMGLLGGIMGGNAQRIAHQASLFAEYEYRRRQNALKNFRDFHGYEAYEAVNMVVILRDYSVPWRKTTIPRVGHKQDTP